MRHHDGEGFMRSVIRTILTLFLLFAPLSSVGRAQQEARSQALQQVSDEVLNKLQAAAIQHEAIAVLLEEQKFPAVIPGLKEIFDLELPQEYEIYQVREVQSVVQKLREKRQLSVAHSAVDLGLKYLEEDKSKASLYLLKSQLYRDSGQIREAAEATELARKFYQSGLRGR